MYIWTQKNDVKPMNFSLQSKCNTFKLIAEKKKNKNNILTLK